MKKLMILCAACLMGISAMAQTIDAIKVTQGGTTDWYPFGGGNLITVTFSNGNPVFPNKTYDLANGNVETTFDTAPYIGEDFVDVASGLKFYITAVGEIYTVKVSGNSYTGTSYDIPASVTYKNVEFAVTEIGYVAFYDCDNLTSITIPASVTAIEEEAFYGCSNLTVVTFAEGSQLEKIQTKTFQNCALTAIAIPASVTEIGYLAFFDCKDLETVTIADNSRLESIGEKAFRNCFALTSITIPATVTEIEVEAFRSCKSLTDVYVNWTSNPTIPGTDAFKDIAGGEGHGPDSATLHVPVGTKSIYENADVWKDFGTIDDLMESIREGVAGNWGTICMEKNITAIDGATFWNVVAERETEFELEQVTEPQAGYGYLIRFTANELRVQYGNQVATTPIEATAEHPIQGTFEAIELNEQGECAVTGNYIVYNNQLCKAGVWVTVGAHRAYVVAQTAPETAPAIAHGPRMTMAKPAEAPTGLGQWNKEQGQRTQKLLRNGQFVIIRDNKMYNTQGNLLNERPKAN